jgi:hypothetical protein
VTLGPFADLRIIDPGTTDDHQLSEIVMRNFRALVYSAERDGDGDGHANVDDDWLYYTGLHKMRAGGGDDAYPNLADAIEFATKFTLGLADGTLLSIDAFQPDRSDHIAVGTYDQVIQRLAEIARAENRDSVPVLVSRMTVDEEEEEEEEADTRGVKRHVEEEAAEPASDSDIEFLGERRASHDSEDDPEADPSYAPGRRPTKRPRYDSHLCHQCGLATARFVALLDERTPRLYCGTACRFADLGLIATRRH